MPIKIVTGCAGAGKTKYCINEMREHNAAGNRCIMLVPSSYSHETEKLMINEFGGTGLNGIDVTSFAKLGRELSENGGTRISAPGKQALVCCAVKACVKKMNGEFSANFIRAVERPGFINIAASTISELHHYGISSDQLRESADSDGAAEDDSTKGLKEKLSFMALLLDEYNSLLSAADYIDGDDDLMRLAAAITERGDSWNGQKIWINHFDELLPQQLLVVRALYEKGADITITFSVCKKPEDTYYGTLESIRYIKDFAQGDIEEVYCDGCFGRLEKRPDLKALFEGWFDNDVYEGNAENIELCEMHDSYMEVEHIAGRILDFVRDKGCRFRDIEIICGDPDSYSHIFNSVFGEYDIPYYLDKKISIASHPVATQILSLFDIIENDWSYESVFEYLRAGFIYRKSTRVNTKTGKKFTTYTPITADEIDKLDNYVFKYKIRGKSMWSRSWNSEDESSAFDIAFPEKRENDKEADYRKAIDELREEAAAPVLRYIENTKDVKTISGYCTALYNFMEEINLPSGIECDILRTKNHADAEVLRLGQIWNHIVDILDELNTAFEALPPGEINGSDFGQYVRAAMTQCMISTIPSGADCVSIGSVEKHRAGNVKILFAAGAVSGTFPNEVKKEGLLSNNERTIISSKIRLAPTTEKKNEQRRYNVYTALSSVEDRLCISYPIHKSDGGECGPSQMVSDIRSRFRSIGCGGAEEKYSRISTPKATIHRAMMADKNEEVWEKVIEWFNSNPEWKNRLDIMSAAFDEYSLREAVISEDSARTLYGEARTYSATKLNSFAECPFRFFMHYGLKIRPRDELEIGASELGTYAHKLLEDSCREMQKEGWRNIDEQRCAEIVDGLIEQATSKLDESSLRDKEYIRELYRRMGDTVSLAARKLYRYMSSGEFRAEGYEHKINIYINPNNKEVRLYEPETEKKPGIYINGSIDRLDSCSYTDDNEKKRDIYRIIDYKTGDHPFVLGNVMAGFDMQPFIYAMAVCCDSTGARIKQLSGVYYSEVCSGYADMADADDEVSYATAAEKNTALYGASFLETGKNGCFIDRAIEALEAKSVPAEDSIFFREIKSGLSADKLIIEARGEKLEQLMEDKLKKEKQLSKLSGELSKIDDTLSYSREDSDIDAMIEAAVKSYTECEAEVAQNVRGAKGRRTKAERTVKKLNNIKKKAEELTTAEKVYSNAERTLGAARKRAEELLLSKLTTAGKERIQAELSGSDNWEKNFISVAQATDFEPIYEPIGDVRNALTAEKLIETVKDNIISADRKILSGMIAIDPVTYNYDACAYCDYNTVCKFDKRKNAQKASVGSNKYKWTELESEVETDGMD